MGFVRLPAENAAIKNDIHPREWTERNIAAMKRQFYRWGVMYVLVARSDVLFPRILSMDAMDLRATLQGRSCLSRRGFRQLVPLVQDGAGERAGCRRGLRAMPGAPSISRSFPNGSSAFESTPIVFWTISTSCRTGRTGFA